MKKYILIVVGLGLIFNFVSAQKNKKTIKNESASSADQKEYKFPAVKYGERSGSVEYVQYTANRCQTKTILYFDRNGDVELKEIFVQNEAGDKRELRHTVVATQNGIETSWDIKNSVNGIDMLKKEFKQFKLLPNENYLRTPLHNFRITKAFDFKSEGTETIGKIECEKFSFALDDKDLKNRVVVSNYKNIPIKIIYSGGVSHMVKFNFNVRFPFEKMNPPADYKMAMDSNFQKKK